MAKKHETPEVDVMALKYDELEKLLKDCKLKDLNPSLTDEQIEWIENDLNIYKQNKK